MLSFDDFARLAFAVYYVHDLTLLPTQPLEHSINDWVQSKIHFIVGPQELLLVIGNKW